MARKRALAWNPRTRLFTYDDRFESYDADPLLRTARAGILTTGWEIGPYPYGKASRKLEHAQEKWFMERSRALSLSFGYATLNGFARAMGICYKTLDIRPSEYPGLRDAIPWIRLSPGGWKYMDLQIMPRILFLAMKWVRYYGRTMRRHDPRSAMVCRAIHRELDLVRAGFDSKVHQDRLRLYLSRRRLPIVSRRVELERRAEARLRAAGIKADIQKIGCIALVSAEQGRQIRTDAPEILPGSVGLADLVSDRERSVYASLISPLSVVTPMYPRREELYRAAGEVWKRS